MAGVAAQLCDFGSSVDLYPVQSSFEESLLSIHQVRRKSCQEKMKRQHPLLELPGGLLALCRWTLGSERHRYAIA